MNNPELGQAIYIFIGVVLTLAAFYLIQIAKRMRGMILFKLRRAFVGIFLCLIGYGLGEKLGYSPLISAFMGFAGGLLSLWAVPAPKRSRNISKRTKQAVIARDQHVDYDSDLHHFDHIVPLAKGGDTSVENLRVLPKKENLRKGAKMPRLKDLL